MVFDHSESAKRYCENINNHSTSGKIDDWDVYYYCAMIGLKHQLLGDPNIKLKEFSKTYTKMYFRSRTLIAGLLIDAELKRTGQNITKENISEMFKKYLDTSDQMLNSDGVALLNRYSQGGFEYLQNKASTQNDVYSFIKTCVELINEIE